MRKIVQHNHSDSWLNANLTFREFLVPGKCTLTDKEFRRELQIRIRGQSLPESWLYASTTVTWEVAGAQAPSEQGAAGSPADSSQAA